MSDQEQGNGEGSAPEYAASKRKSPPVVTNDGTVRDELSAPEKLRIGGYMAPALRSGAKDGRTKRKVYVEGKDGSVRESTWGEVAQALSIKHGIAFEVAEKTPETTYACRVCAREFVWEKRGSVPYACDECKNQRCGCGAKLNKASWCRSLIEARGDRQTKCINCYLQTKRIDAPMCTGCGATLGKHAAKPSNPRAPRCRACYFESRKVHKDVLKCACGASLNARLLSPSAIARRSGAPARCRRCAYKSMQTSMRHKCACGAYLCRNAMSPGQVRLRNGAPPQCIKCSRASRRKKAAQ